MSKLGIFVIVLSITGLSAGCKKESADASSGASQDVAAPLRVAQVDLGSAIGSDKRVAVAKTDFRPNETIYASVATEGSANNATLTARWTYQDGQVVDESSQTISPNTNAVSEFHVSKPSGWPTGKYQVQILLNGSAVQTKEFEVK